MVRLYERVTGTVVGTGHVSSLGGFSLHDRSKMDVSNVPDFFFDAMVYIEDQACVIAKKGTTPFLKGYDAQGRDDAVQWK